MTTTSRPADWDAAYGPETGVSHRSTTSSRFPGRAIEGSVTYVLERIVPCPDCGVMRRASPYPHAPRWVRADVGTWRQVDCVGRVLTNEP